MLVHYSRISTAPLSRCSNQRLFSSAFHLRTLGCFCMFSLFYFRVSVFFSLSVRLRVRQVTLYRIEYYLLIVDLSTSGVFVLRLSKRQKSVILIHCYSSYFIRALTPAPARPCLPSSRTARATAAVAPSRARSAGGWG